VSVPQQVEEQRSTGWPSEPGDAVRAGSVLDQLMREALAVPGAAEALLEAFAAQSRALRLVQEAEARGAATLPVDLRQRLAHVAQRTPVWLAAGAGLGLVGVRR
jgi:hypothetical protein